MSFTRDKRGKKSQKINNKARTNHAAVSVTDRSILMKPKWLITIPYFSKTRAINCVETEKALPGTDPATFRGRTQSTHCELLTQNNFAFFVLNRG